MINESNSIIRYTTYALPFSNAVYVGLQTIDTFGEQTACWGSVVSQSWVSGTKDIVAVEAVYNTLTAVTGAIWHVSLQNLSSSANPIRPDGVVQQVWTGSTSLLSLSNVVSHTLDVPRTVNVNDKFAAVFKYDTFAATAVVSVRATTKAVSVEEIGSSVSTTTGSTWVDNGSSIPSVRFRCSDGSYIYFDGQNGISTSFAIGTDFLQNSTGTGIDSGDERGVLWIPKKSYMITSAASLMRRTGAATTVNLCFYKDEQLLASQSFDSSSNRTISNHHMVGITFDPPIRVESGSSYRLTQQPTSTTNGVRWYRYGFNSPEDKVMYLGGVDAESEISITNRVNLGSWNTPISASFSFHPVQFYGYPITGSELLSGSSVVSGSITKLGDFIEGAVIRAVRQSDNIAISTSSNASGYYQFSLASGSYHLVVEYESSSQKFNALSQWDVPVI